MKRFYKFTSKDQSQRAFAFRCLQNEYAVMLRCHRDETVLVSFPEGRPSRSGDFAYYFGEWISLVEEKTWNLIEEENWGGQEVCIMGKTFRPSCVIRETNDADSIAEILHAIAVPYQKFGSEFARPWGMIQSPEIYKLEFIYTLKLLEDSFRTKSSEYYIK